MSSNTNSMRIRGQTSRIIKPISATASSSPPLRDHVNTRCERGRAHVACGGCLAKARRHHQPPMNSARIRRLIILCTRARKCRPHPLLVPSSVSLFRVFLSTLASAFHLPLVGGFSPPYIAFAVRCQDRLRFFWRLAAFQSSLGTCRAWRLTFALSRRGGRDGLTSTGADRPWLAARGFYGGTEVAGCARWARNVAPSSKRSISPVTTLELCIDRCPRQKRLH